MTKLQRSHRVAVNAYLVKNNKFLMLKRSTSPYIWVPPGGKLAADEDPILGLKREIREETNLEANILAPVNTWFGIWENLPLLSIDYLAEAINGEIRLSAEHTTAEWVSLEELRAGVPVSLDSDIGFTLNNFAAAQRLMSLFK